MMTAARVTKRIRKHEAKEILERHCGLAGQGVSSFTVNGTARPEGKERAWWTERMRPTEAADTQRSIAYLRAYVEIAGPYFFATGIGLEGAFLHPDKSVIKRLFDEGFLQLDEASGRFSLTTKGQALL